MRHSALIIIAALAASSSIAHAAPPKVSPIEAASIFKAAGFVKKGAQWRTECGRDDPSASYEAGAIAEYRDINGDGRPDALVTEGGSYCYGNTGTGYWLLSRQTSGAWKLMNQSQGMAEFLQTKGAEGWPDISVGGPGFCFPVMRWNGKAYVLNRNEYAGKRCRP